MNKYVLLKICAILIAVFAQILLKISANKKYDNKIKEYLNPYVIFAYGFSAIGTLLSSFSLRGISISFSAIIESLNYILIPIFSLILLKESINRKQLIGMLIIVLGIFIFNI